MKNQLKHIEERNRNSTHISECESERPFYLIHCNGEPFYAYGLIKECSFKTMFFTVKSIDQKKHSAVLNILVPYTSQKGEMFLLRTETKIVVDLSCFCGFSTVSIPTVDCIILRNMIKDHLKLPLLANKSDSPQVIWNSNENELNNTATITFHYQKGLDVYVMIDLYMRGKKVSLIIPRGNKRAITVIDLLKIDIQPPSKMIIGTVEIQLNRIDKRKVSLK